MSTDRDKVVAKYGTDNDDDTPFHNGDAGDGQHAYPGYHERAHAVDVPVRVHYGDLTPAAQKIIDEAEGKK